MDNLFCLIRIVLRHLGKHAGVDYKDFLRGHCCAQDKNGQIDLPHFPVPPS